MSSSKGQILDAIRQWINKPIEEVWRKHGFSAMIPCECRFTGPVRICPICQGTFSGAENYFWIYRESNSYSVQQCSKAYVSFLSEPLHMLPVCSECAKSLTPRLDFVCDFFPDVLRQIIGEYAFEKILDCRQCKDEALRV